MISKIIHYWGDGGTVLFCGEKFGEGFTGKKWTSQIEEITCKKCLIELVKHHNKMAEMAFSQFLGFENGKT